MDHSFAIDKIAELDAKKYRPGTCQYQRVCRILLNHHHSFLDIEWK